MIERSFTDEERYARATLAYFTPEKPFMVGKAMYDAMAKQPALADMMDRVKLYPVFDPLSGDVDIAKPEAWDFLRSVAHGNPAVIVGSVPTPPSWVRDLWDFPHTVIHESPPCAFSASAFSCLFEHDPREVERVLFIHVEKARGSDPIEEIKALRSEMYRPVTMQEIRDALGPTEPESLPNARRYGPYDADPHLKGRRRRFRKQRRT